jgi:hypothetical protein
MLQRELRDPDPVHRKDRILDGDERITTAARRVLEGFANSSG